MKDVTQKFSDAINSFSCDFNLAKEGDKESILILNELIKNNDDKLMQDIDLLSELSYLIRHGKAMIIATE